MKNLRARFYELRINPQEERELLRCLSSPHNVMVTFSDLDKCGVSAVLTDTITVAGLIAFRAELQKLFKPK